MSSTFLRYRRDQELKWSLVFRDIMAGRDSRGNGFTLDEFRCYINEFLGKKKTTAPEIKAIYDDLNVENADYISQAVFVDQMSKPARKEAFESIFNMKDVNRDGCLGPEEIQDALTLLGVPPQNIKKFVSDVDKNSDGRISKSEFMKMV